MSLINFMKKLYSPGALDTRFFISANTPPAEAIKERANPEFKSTPLKDSKPSLWRSPEYVFYYLLLMVVIPLMIKSPIDVSQSSHPNYPKFEHLLSDGWLFGRKMDNSDAQYDSFRENIPALFCLLVLHPLIRRAYDYLTMSHIYTPQSSSPSTITQGIPSSLAADTRLSQRTSFDYYFAIIFIIALHGFSSIKILLILYINFKIAKSFSTNQIPTITWIFNIGILFANEFGRGYRYSIILGSFGQWLDHHGGLISRWEVLFNICILRLISFNMDYYWSQNSGQSSPMEKKQLDPSNLSEKDRVTIPPSHEDFSFKNYIAYILYAPLYLTGPIITFNNYISQQRYKSPTITTERIILYAIRFFIVLFAMELIIHFIYAVAIAKSNPDWTIYTPFQLSMLGYFNLHHIWLKLLIPWRFFRLWSLLDDVDPPENMARCMSNNYSALAFWRGWHRSYNRWIVRYIYIPIGGSGSTGILGTLRSIANFALVFMFVAIWHDINLRLLMWGWLITLFVLPEIIATLLFPSRKFKDNQRLYRILCGIGAIGNVLMMMIANLVGYAIGIDGLKGLLHGMIGSTSGLFLFSAICGSLYTGVQVMFETREQEKRDGIRMPC